MVSLQQFEKSLIDMDQSKLEFFAELYAILRTTEKLERLVVRDSITQNQYETLCYRLINSYKQCQKALNFSYDDVDQFIQDYGMEVPLAQSRLKQGLPELVKSSKRDEKSGYYAVIRSTEIFITLMDALRLEQLAVENLLPDVHQLVITLNQVDLDQDSKIMSKMNNWHHSLNQKRATEDISHDESKQFILDLETSYQEFMHQYLNK